MQNGGFKLTEHPADSFIDYNSMVDNLEEEHMRRDVFTTAYEVSGISLNQRGLKAENAD